MVVRLFIVFIVVWQAVAAPVAMGAMTHESPSAASAAHATHASAHGEQARAHHEAAKPCCDVAGHCTPPGLPVAVIAVSPAPPADKTGKRPAVSRPSGFPNPPYRPPSARLS